ncbi:MAG: ribulose-phosphate 3-epimerase [bacterium]
MKFESFIFMPEIIPAILAKDFDDLKKKIKLVEPYVDWVQLDIGDGKFTATKTWDNPEDLKKIETKLNFEVHLMISEPEKEIDRWIVSGVKRILIHYESTEKLTEISEKLKAAGMEMGLVLNLQTPINVLENFPISQFPNFQVIQLMGIQEIGYYGHPFSERVLPKIFDLRSKYSDIKIAVDGGINAETGKKAAASGADILVAGSAIFGSADIKGSIEKLKNIII